jgi:hypothetical protein
MGGGRQAHRAQRHDDRREGEQTVGNFVDAEQGAHLEGHIKDMLTQAVGPQPEVEVALTEVATEPRDLLADVL